MSLLSAIRTTSVTEPVIYDRVDAAFMRRALELSWRGAGFVDPNPMVGAVIVQSGQIVGEGYHARCGAAHAETVALNDAGTLSMGATMYVTLEPCSHFGKTPPCVNGVIAGGIERVVVATIDPDEKVSGRGIDMLRAAGINVEVGCLAAAAMVQNYSYYANRLDLGSVVTLKMASTMDGKIASAPGRRDQITGPMAQHYVHQLRALHDAVLVGVDTVIADQPRLDCRLLKSHDISNPMPVVMDTHLRTPLTNQWSARSRPYLLLCGEGADRDLRRAHEAVGAHVISCRCDDHGISVPHALDTLKKIGLERVLVEGGASVFSAFVRTGLWNSLLLFQSSLMFGEDGVPLFRGSTHDMSDARIVDSESIDGDILHRMIHANSFDAVASRIAEAR